MVAYIVALLACWVSPSIADLCPDGGACAAGNEEVSLLQTNIALKKAAAAAAMAIQKHQNDSMQAPMGHKGDGELGGAVSPMPGGGNAGKVRMVMPMPGGGNAGEAPTDGDNNYDLYQDATCSKPNDIVMILGENAALSVHRAQYLRRQRFFARLFVDFLGQCGCTNVAVLMYPMYKTTAARQTTPFTEDLKKVKVLINRKLKKPKGPLKNLDGAMADATDMFQTSSRPGATKTAIVFTNGKVVDKRPVDKAARQLRKVARVMMVSVWPRGTMIRYLKGLATPRSKNNPFNMIIKGGFRKKVKRAAANICDTGPDEDEK